MEKNKAGIEPAQSGSATRRVAGLPLVQLDRGVSWHTPKAITGVWKFNVDSNHNPFRGSRLWGSNPLPPGYRPGAIPSLLRRQLYYSCVTSKYLFFSITHAPPLICWSCALHKCISSATSLGDVHPFSILRAHCSICATISSIKLFSPMRSKRCVAIVAIFDLITIHPIPEYYSRVNYNGNYHKQ